MKNPIIILNQSLGPIFILSLLMILSQAAFSQVYFSKNVKQVWETEAEFKIPESVFYDRNSQMIYVANINGSPTEKDKNGFLSLLSADGKIIELQWVSGLNAPKGMNVHDGKLYVADIDRVAEIDIENKEILRFYAAENAQFLNDVIADENGNIYISDMMRGAIYKISDGKIAEWIPAQTFQKPNGMYYLDGIIYLGKKDGIVKIDPSTKQTTSLAAFTGSVDGLEIDTEGNFIFSDWSGKVQLLKPGKQVQILFNTSDAKINAADIHLIRSENILLVPTFYDNRIVAYEILR
jgi:sugar lactone lactonase YvrE